MSVVPVELGQHHQPVLSTPLFVVRSRDVHEWRGLVGAVVRRLGGDEDAVTTARRGVTELLTNVLQHAGCDRRCRLEVAKVGGFVRVEVHDFSRQVPAVQWPGDDIEHGRGLYLVRDMADGLGYDLTETGKIVWFRLRVGTEMIEESE